MNVQSLFGLSAYVDAEWLAIGVFEGQREIPEALGRTVTGRAMARLLAKSEVPTDVGNTMPLHGVSGTSASYVLFFGLGRRERFTNGTAYAAGVAVIKALTSKDRGTVVVLLPEGGDPAEVASALTEGLITGLKSPELRKAKPERKAVGSLSVLFPMRSSDDRAPALARAVARGVVVGEAVNLARDLANTPPAEKSPTVLANFARETAEGLGLGVEVWDSSRIDRERFGGLAAVSAGSAEPPAFVCLSHLRGGDGPTLALVGKGITFDSGGLSLKPSASMEDMKADMTGAAVVLATLTAVARLELPVNVRGYLALAENMTGGRAMKLGDVLTMRDGTTVEVLNTDAEGRLVLADALSYAAEAAPWRILDLATLTGACITALGTKIAGLFATDDTFAADVLDACRITGERAWRLPLDDDFDEGLRSNVADWRNIAGKWGGAITAAKFLQHFTADLPWVHLDIAGPSWAEGDATRDPGGTGCFVRTLVTMLERQAAVRDTPAPGPQ